MSRLLQNKINNDPEIIRLRMDVEDLINSIDSIDDEIFDKEASRLKKAIDKRIEFIMLKEENPDSLT